MRVLNILWKVVLTGCLLVTTGSLTYIALRLTVPLMQGGSAAADPSAKGGAAVDGLLTGLAGALDQVGGPAASSGSLNPMQQGAQKLRSLQEQIGAQRGFEQITNGLDNALGQGAVRNGPSRVQGGDAPHVEVPEAAEPAAAPAANPNIADPMAALGKGQIGELVRKLGGGDLKLDGLRDLESQLGAFGGLGGLGGGGALPELGDGPQAPEEANAPSVPEAKPSKRSVVAGELKHIERPAKPAPAAKGPTRIE